MKPASNDKPVRRRLGRRLFKWLLAALGVLLLVVALLMAWVGGTRSGLQFAWSLAAPRLPDSIAISQVEGRLIGPLTVTGIEVDTPGMHVAVQHVTLQWQAAALLGGTLHVEQLALRGVHYRAKPMTRPAPEQQTGEPFALPDAVRLPLQVRVDAVRIEDATVATAPDAAPIVLQQARVQDVRLTRARWRIGSVTASGPRFDVEAAAQVVPQGRYATTLTLQASLRLPDWAPIKTELSLSGDLEQLQLHTAVAAPYNATLNARISSIALDAPKQIDIDATLALAHTQPAAISADLPTLAPITTTLHVSGTPARLRLEQSVAAPYNARLDATLTQLLATPGIDARLRLADSRLTAIKQGLPPVTLDTTLTVSGSPQALALQLDARADSARFGSVNAAARLQYTPAAIRIRKLTLRRPDTPMQLSAHGTVALARGHAMAVVLRWQQLRWPLTGPPDYVSEQGQFSITGPLQDYRIEGHMGWQVTGQGDGQLHMAARGDLQSLHLRRLSINGAPGQIQAQAEVSWAPALRLQAHVEGTHINPGAFVAAVPGDFSLQADIRAAQQEDGRIIARVEQLSAQGSLRGQPLQLAAQLAWLGDHVRIRQLGLDYAQNQLTVSGRAGWQPSAKLALQWQLQAPQLAALWPTLAGQLHSQGQISGSVAAPQIEATLTAQELAYADYRLASLELQADVDWSGTSRSRLTLDVAGIQAAGQHVRSLTLDLLGTPADHALEVDLDSDTAQLALALQGALAKPTMAWAFELTALRAAYGEFAPWRLTAPASGRVTARHQHINKACLRSGDARLCVQGEHDDTGVRGALQLDDLAFAYVRSLLPENLTIGGALSGTMQAQIPAAGQPTVSVQLHTTAGQIVARQRDGDEIRVLAFKPATLQAELADRALHATLQLPLTEGGGLQAQLAVAPGTTLLTTRPLTGSLQLNVARLDFVTRLVSEVAAIDGHIQGDVRVSGTLAKPRVLGEIVLQAQRLALLTPGLVLTDTRLQARGQGERIALSLSTHSGGGELNVHGDIGFAAAGATVKLDITGQAFQIANTPVVRASISPDLLLSMTPRKVRVEGTLGVPKARIMPRDLPAAGVQTVADDTVIVGEEKSVAESAARAIHADIKVVLGDVRIKGFGLKTGVTGSLQVQQAPGEPVTAAGKLTLVDGSYRAYGQNLDIQSGQIYFSGGPITSPGIRLRAARYPAEDITVGVRVTGSVEHPTVQLFSDPAMSQAEILSWLLLGRPLSGTTGGQENLIAKAALALGSGRGNQVLDQIGAALGVDDIGIGSAAGHGANEAAFMVGKYLTPRLYIKYGVGIFSSISTLSLRYTLNSHWKITSETSGAATGADIIYTFER